MPNAPVPADAGGMPRILPDVEEFPCSSGLSRRSILMGLSGAAVALPAAAVTSSALAAGGMSRSGTCPSAPSADAYRTAYTAEDRLQHHLAMAAQAASEIVGDARWRIAMFGVTWRMSFDLQRSDLVHEPHPAVPGGITVERERRVLAVVNGEVIRRGA